MAAEPVPPPQDLNAEEATLGAMLLGGDRADEAATLLQPGDFYRTQHQAVFEACLALRERGVGVDLVTVANELRLAGSLDELGGYPALDRMMRSVPLTSNVATYAGIVRDMAHRRAQLLDAAAMRQDVADGLDPAEVSKRVERRERTTRERYITSADARPRKSYGAATPVGPHVPFAAEGVLPPNCEPGRFRLDDLGNGERLAALYGDRLLWCADVKRWHYFDGSRWAPDKTNQALALAGAVARGLLVEAACSPNGKSSDILKHASASGSHGRLAAMLACAQAGLTVTSETFDVDPLLLNCANGTIDLATGELRPHDKADMLSRRCEAVYLPGEHLTDHPGAVAWQAFLAQTFPDEELRGYVQRIMGYSIAGHNQHQRLVLAHGVTRTGKSTLYEALGIVLGDYAETIDSSALLRKKGDESELRPELAKLRGVRFVVTSEVSSGKAFNAGLVKNLTGGERISTAAKYQDPITWAPAFTPHLRANDLPRIPHDDDAMWWRVTAIPFKQQVAAELVDLGLQARLVTEGATAILAWLVAGYLDWQADGFGTCAAVEAEQTAYKAEQDPLGEWWGESVTVTGVHKDEVAGLDLYSYYLEWCSDNSEKNPVARRTFGALVGARLEPGSARKVRSGGRAVNGYRGVKLQPPEAVQVTVHSTSGDDPDSKSQESHGCQVDPDDPEDPTNLRAVESRVGDSRNHPDHPDHPDQASEDDDDHDPFAPL